ncbi:mycofactocin-coupled SDR family oxidoreductase [Mycolicibacterium tusciae]|uniref:mycofactocin-coupled SDR family oxidoreductase n=1 Tax=Mycolicibacterium tusciae TaxID=75922 RepID=UPI00024A3BA1
MVASLEGKVALITGAARGMGRAHAVKLAGEGADVIAIDICADFESTDYPGATAADLAETARLVESLGRRIVFRQADVRDADAMDAVVADGLAEFGRIDIVLANAGIIRVTDCEHPRQTFRDIVDVNLVGAWNTVDAAITALISGGRGGSIVLTSSTQGLKASGTDRAGLQAYAASKRALVALMQGWALQLAPHSIRVNTIHPSGVATSMIINEATMTLAGANDPWLLAQQNALPIPLLQPEDVAGAVAWLVSDAGQFITGTSWPLDAGFTLRS